MSAIPSPPPVEEPPRREKEVQNYYTLYYNNDEVLSSITGLLQNMHQNNVLFFSVLAQYLSVLTMI